MKQNIPKKTIGSYVYDQLLKPHENQSIVDTQREMQKPYVDELVKCAKKHEDLFGDVNPFYICVQTRRERLLQNVVRSQFYARQTRPSPQYDLALYYYDPKNEQLAFVWCIPDIETVEYLIQNEAQVDPDERQLLAFCKSFKAGTLI